MMFEALKGRLTVILIPLLQFFQQTFCQIHVLYFSIIFAKLFLFANYCRFVKNVE